MAKPTKKDPTGQRGNRKSATAKLQRRFTRAESKVKAMVRRIPRERKRQAVLVNAPTIPVYEYEISAEELEQLNEAIRDTVDLEVLETTADRMSPNWWWQDAVEVPYRQGTASE